jgi:5-amino-6-(5-phosphoribosylamino)uracil reductase
MFAVESRMGLPKNKPLLILKLAMSLNGFLDEGTGQRSTISNEKDRASVDILRSLSDAILIGGGTARFDNPRLLLYSKESENRRIAKGKSPHPKRIILWGSSSSLEKFKELTVFTNKEAETVLIIPEMLEAETRRVLPHIKTVTHPEKRISIQALIDLISSLHLHTLLIEGGSVIAREFLMSQTIDAIRLAYSPVTFNPGKAKGVSVFYALKEKEISSRPTLIENHGSMFSCWYCLNDEGRKFSDEQIMSK